jgi:hypothetical protein
MRFEKALALPLGGAAPTLSLVRKQLGSNLFPRNRCERISTAFYNAAMQLSLLSLWQLNGIWRFHSDAIPYILDELDTL